MRGDGPEPGARDELSSRFVTVDCPECLGDGEFSVSSDPNARTYRCGECDGTGTVERPIEERFAAREQRLQAAE